MIHVYCVESSQLGYARESIGAERYRNRKEAASEWPPNRHSRVMKKTQGDLLDSHLSIGVAASAGWLLLAGYLPPAAPESAFTSLSTTGHLFQLQIRLRPLHTKFTRQSPSYCQTTAAYTK